MRYIRIKRHLKPYSIASRESTIAHAFASAIAPNDEFDDEKVREAILWLGQDPDKDLRCAYCDSDAKTWDHVAGIVKSKRFSGFGHRIGNLLPCCEHCNSSKGNLDWKMYMSKIEMPEKKRQKQISLIQSYLDQFTVYDILPEGCPEIDEMEEIKGQIIELMVKADEVASRLRTRLAH